MCSAYTVAAANGWAGLAPNTYFVALATNTAMSSSCWTIHGYVACGETCGTCFVCRSSRLTHLLQDSLGGNCNTTLLVTVAPCVDAFEDSLAALKFADRARNISNKAVVNSMHDTETILALKVGIVGSRLFALLARLLVIVMRSRNIVHMVQHKKRNIVLSWQKTAEMS